MKLSKKFLILIAVVFIASVGIAVAEDATIGGHSFTVPDGFKVLNTTDEMVVLSSDNNHAISVIVQDSVKNTDDAKTYLEGQGYKFIGEDTYNADGKDVQQQNYEKDGFTVLSYIFPADDDYCIVAYTVPDGDTIPEGADNPVTTILNSIK